MWVPSRFREEYELGTPPRAWSHRLPLGARAHPLRSGLYELRSLRYKCADQVARTSRKILAVVLLPRIGGARARAWCAGDRGGLAPGPRSRPQRGLRRTTLERNVGGNRPTRGLAPADRPGTQRAGRRSEPRHPLPSRLESRGRRSDRCRQRQDAVAVRVSDVLPGRFRLRRGPTRGACGRQWRRVYVWGRGAAPRRGSRERKEDLERGHACAGSACRRASLALPVRRSSRTGRVVANIGGKNAGIVAFDAKTGKVLWTVTDDGASYSSGIGATIAGRRYAVFLTRNGLVGLDPATGQVRFERPWRARQAASVNAATPVDQRRLDFRVG